MQTTLLSLAIAVILALVAAIVAPLVVDWNHYRGAFEAEASRLCGVNVRINGAIEAQLLPAPVVILHDVDAGPPGGKPQMRAGMLKLDLALGPLLSGQAQATEVRLIAPQVTVALARSGSVDVQGLPAARFPALSIAHLDVEDGRVTLRDAASGARLALQHLSFVGAAGGSFAGTGAATVGATAYGYRIAGADDGRGGLRIRLGVAPEDRPLTAAFDGTLRLTDGVPQFDGSMALARPVGATLASGRKVVSVPWRATGAIKASPAAATISQFAFDYGPQERSLDLVGSAALTFGAHPMLAGKLAALQLDVDRALAAPDLTRRAPLLAIGQFLQAFTAALAPPVATRLDVDVDALTVGGAAIEALHGGLAYDGAGWRIDNLRFHAPGMSDIRVSGALRGAAQGYAFAGKARVDSADAAALWAFVDGGGGRRASRQPRALAAQGDVVIAADRLAVDRLSASLGRERVSGRLAYDWPQADHPARLDAALQADDLDLDALAGVLGPDQRALVLPRQVQLALTVGNARFFGIDARAVAVRLLVDAGQWRISALTIGDLDGARLALNGSITPFAPQPSGRLTLDLDAGALDGIGVLAARFAPAQQGNALRRLAGQLAPAALHAQLDVKPAAGSGSTAVLHVAGTLAALHVAVDAAASGEESHAGAAALTLNGRLDADDGTALVRLFGLERVVAAGRQPGRLAFSASGPLDGVLAVDGRLAAGGFGAGAQGRLQLGAGAPVKGTLQLGATAADLRPLQQAMSGQAGAATAVAARAGLAIDGKTLTLSNLAATIGSHSLQGGARIDLGDPIGVDGAFAADTADAAAVAALLLGWPRDATGSGWSPRPIGAGAFGPVEANVNFSVGSAALTPALTATALKGALHLAPARLAFDDIDGGLAGGHLTGALSFRRNGGALAARVDMKLARAAAATLAGPGFDVRSGQASAALRSEGFGASPLSLIGSLHGSATLALANAQIAGLDPAAFDAAIAAAGDGAASELAKVGAAVDAVAAKGHVEVPQGKVAIAIASGAADMRDARLATKDGGELALDGAVDLSQGTLGARLTLSRPPPDGLVRSRPGYSVDLEGPLAAPQRSLDVLGLTSWLTLRAAELQARRIESIEAVRHDAVAGSALGAPGAHLVEPGTVYELTAPPSLWPAPGAQARAIEHLVPVAPGAPPAAPSGAAAGDPPPAGAPGPLDLMGDGPPAPAASAGTAAPARRPAPAAIGAQP